MARKREMKLHPEPPDMRPVLWKGKWVLFASGPMAVDLDSAGFKLGEPAPIPKVLAAPGMMEFEPRPEPHPYTLDRLDILWDGGQCSDRATIDLQAGTVYRVQSYGEMILIVQVVTLEEFEERMIMLP